MGLALDHVSVVVTDLERAKAFFGELGMELEGQATLEGDWVDRVNAMQGIKVDIAMMRTPDGDGKIELTRFINPPVPARKPEPPNTLGLRSIMFEVDDVDETVDRLGRCGAELIGEVAQYENEYRLCYLRGPDGIIVALAESLRTETSS
jgi:catechol 2,3-dioxygenase-like lactoylglutathione lyase family enzyme